MDKFFKILISFLIGTYSSTLIAQGNSYLFAQACFKKNEYKLAVEYLDKQLAEYPNHQESKILRAKANLSLYEYSKALKDLEGLKSSKNNDILLLESRAYAGLGNESQSIEKLKQYKNTGNKSDLETIKGYPEFSKYNTLAEWADFWKTWTYTDKEKALINIDYAIKSERYAEAADRLDEFLLKYKTNGRAYYLRGTLNVQNKQYKDAVENFGHALEIEKDNLDYKTAFATAQYYAGQNKKALENFNSILEKDSLMIDAYKGRAEANLGAGNSDKALDDMAIYRKYYPEDKSAQFLEARILTKSGNYLEAISSLGKLIKSDPGSPEYFVGRADAYVATKTYAYAIKDYSMALDLDPKNIETFKKRARANELKGDFGNACIDWGHAARLGDIESLNNSKKYCN